MKKKFLAALCVAAGLLAGGTAEASVATVDMRTLFTDNPSWQASARHAAERRAQLEREFDQRSEGLTGAELAALIQEYREKFRADERADMRETYERVTAVIAEVAKEQGYDTVVRSRSLLYGTADGDITEAVKARL